MKAERNPLLLPANARAVKAARARDGRPTEYRVKGARGLVLRVRPPPPGSADSSASGAASFYCYYHTGKGPKRRLVKVRLGNRDVTRLADASEAAEQIMRRVEAGSDPVAEKRAASASTVDALLDEHLKRHVRPNLRSADEVERVFRVYVRPAIGSKSIYELHRRDVVEMLDKIEDQHGPVMSDRVLAHLRKCFNWHAARDDQFNTPVVKGMARTSPAERARKRMLDDEELRDLWRALGDADVPSCFPAYVRTLLLTAQRRTEVARMAWDDIVGNVWTISADGHKTGDRVGAKHVPLTPAVVQLLGQRSNGFVFSSKGGSEAFSGFSKAKRALDAQLATLRKADGRRAMPHWTLHDLRRTARSLMSRAGVTADTAERTIGHVIGGVRGVYDRHSFLDEKRDALSRLADLVERITNQREGQEQPAEAAAPGQ